MNTTFGDSVIAIVLSARISCCCSFFGEFDEWLVMTEKFEQEFPEPSRLSRGFAYSNYYVISSGDSVVTLSLGNVRWIRCCAWGSIFLLAYTWLIALSCRADPTAEIHPFVYVLGLIVAISPFVFPLLRQCALSHHRPSVCLRPDLWKAELFRGTLSYDFINILSFADCTWVDGDGDANGELQVLCRDGQTMQWHLIAQRLGPADESFRKFAEELSRIVRCRHITINDRR
ncbi:MAG: hypothetical protein AAF483_11775 [Planctomycetota bacterium]